MVLCYCESDTSRLVRNRRKINDVFRQLGIRYQTSDELAAIPDTLRDNTPRPFYVYLPRRMVSVGVVDIQQQQHQQLSLSDPLWGTPEFYTRYCLRPNTYNFSDRYNNEKFYPNGRCNSMGWAKRDIVAAIQFSGLPLRQQNFANTKVSLTSLASVSDARGRYLRNTGEPRSLYNTEYINSRIYHNLIRMIDRGVRFTSIRSFGLLPQDRRVVPSILGINGLSEYFNSDSTYHSAEGGRLYRDQLQNRRTYFITHRLLPESGYRAFLPAENRLNTIRNGIDTIIPRYYKVTRNIYLAMVADFLAPKIKAVQQIQRSYRQELELGTEPKEGEWQHICSRIRSSDLDTRRLRDIIVENF